MRAIGQLITEKLVADGRVTEANRYVEQVNNRLKTVDEFKRIYGDILSFTSTWHPGQGSQIDGTKLFKGPVGSKLP